MSTTDERLHITFGRRTYPDDVRAVWGARLIAPSDLLHDRQDLAARTDGDKMLLIAWLNGQPAGTGAIRKMQSALTGPCRIDTSKDVEHVIYEDEIGMIVGSGQASFGYVYVAGWLK